MPGSTRPSGSIGLVDWPGFGDRPRPRVDWTPRAYLEFLQFLLATIVARIAAGHGATYALMCSLESPQSISRPVMIAPTWCGPLPTMLNGHRAFLDRICGVVDLPALGPIVYRFNVNRVVVRLMSVGHVYADTSFLTPERLREKLDAVRAAGARFGSIRFVTGGLDPVDRREEFLSLARRTTVPILLVHGAETPPKSQAEIEAVALLPGIRRVRLPRGDSRAWSSAIAPGCSIDPHDVGLREAMRSLPASGRPVARSRLDRFWLPRAVAHEPLEAAGE